MTRYALHDPDTQVWVGDCRQLLGELPEQSVDLIFADPPFNQGEPYGVWKDLLTDAAYALFTGEWLEACLRVLGPRGTLVLNLPDRLVVGIASWLDAAGLEQTNWCIWHYRFGVWTNQRFVSSKTHVLFYARDRKSRTWNPEAVFVASDRASRYDDPRTRTTANPGLRVPLDVWGPWDGEGWGRVQGNNRERRGLHPNQLPEKYLERVVKACSHPGDWVLDPFLGSGTTGTVARALGRRSLGIEISPEFAASAFDRIQQGPVRLAG